MFIYIPFREHSRTKSKQTAMLIKGFFAEQFLNMGLIKARNVHCSKFL